MKPKGFCSLLAVLGPPGTGVVLPKGRPIRLVNAILTVAVSRPATVKWARGRRLIVGRRFRRH
ncbi:MAG: hypothetical protein R3E00_08640 [Paracoccaceae bacterium]